MKKDDPILSRLRALADPNMDQHERQLALLKMYGSVAADIKLLQVTRWNKRAELAHLAEEIAKDRSDVLMLVTEETDPNTNKKLYTNSDMREAEVTKRLSQDDTHCTLVDSAKSLETEIATELDAEIDYRVSINRVINSYLLSYGNLDRQPIH